MDLPQHISPQQDQRVSPQEDVRQVSARAQVTDRDSSGRRPSRKQFFTGDQLQQSHQIPHQETEILDPGGKRRIDSPATTTSLRGSCQKNQRQGQLETPQSKTIGNSGSGATNQIGSLPLDPTTRGTYTILCFQSANACWLLCQATTPSNHHELTEV